VLSISEGRASTPEADGEAMYEMGFAMAQLDITHPTRQQMAESLGIELADERMDKMGFAANPTSRQHDAT
jgi:hypothetical protein